MRRGVTSAGCLHVIDGKDHSCRTARLFELFQTWIDAYHPCGVVWCGCGVVWCGCGVGVVWCGCGVVVVVVEVR